MRQEFVRILCLFFLLAIVSLFAAWALSGCTVGSLVTIEVQEPQVSLFPERSTPSELTLTGGQPVTAEPDTWLVIEE